MGTAPMEEKKAVESGYWNLFRFDPRLKLDNRNPFLLDSKAPSLNYRDFIMNEVRYSALERTNPARAEKLFTAAEKQSRDKYEHLLKLSQLYENKD